MPDASSNVRGLTAQIAVAYLGQNTVSISAIPGLISTIAEALGKLETDTFARCPIPIKDPAVSIRRSVTPEYLVCLEDGKKLKMLKRHLKANYGLTPDEYRARWNLPSDYPMVAPGYAAERSRLAKQSGLGKRSRVGKAP